MTENEARLILEEIKQLDDTMYAYSGNYMKALDMAIKALEEVQEYRKLGTVEELKKSVKKEDVFKFYYCESEDDYYIGKRLGNMYYAKYENNGFVWFMSRYLPWGEHIVAPHTLWKEHTYPSEPKEIHFIEWLQGFMKKYCGGTVEEVKNQKHNLSVAYKIISDYQDIGTVEEVREAVEKTNGMKVTDIHVDEYYCPNCGSENLCDQGVIGDKYCPNCGQKLESE